MIIRHERLHMAVQRGCVENDHVVQTLTPDRSDHAFHVGSLPGVTAACMEQFIGCDAHKKYSVFVAVNERGEASAAIRVVHDREQYRQFLERLPAGSQIALEAGAHYYWMEMRWKQPGTSRD